MFVFRPDKSFKMENMESIGFHVVRRGKLFFDISK